MSSDIYYQGSGFISNEMGVRSHLTIHLHQLKAKFLEVAQLLPLILSQQRL